MSENDPYLDAYVEAEKARGRAEKRADSLGVLFIVAMAIFVLYAVPECFPRI
tara:strand:- start:274 stop:429 length:156 start_codon:yes stop_codon:yes gene_type:complete